MDLEDRDLAALEERLYSSIHHSYEEATPAKNPDPPPPPVPAPATRIVSRMTVVNNSQGIQANMKRYWVGSAAPISGERAPYVRNHPTDDAVPTQSAPGASVSETVRDVGGNELKKMFLTPYQSLLGNNNDDKVSESPPVRDSPLPENGYQNQNVPERTAAQKHTPKEPSLQFKKKKQTKQSGQYVEKRLASLLKLIDKDRKENAMQVLESKKTKANRVRQGKRTPVVVAEICIDSSDEESQPVKRHIEPAATSRSLSDEETDEVIIIPTSPPPQICIDCSDEEEPTSSISSRQFALPKSKNNKKQKVAPATSSRCHSPSNSSIMSDDFIGQHDRSRLNDSFTESIPSDDELVNTMEGNRRAGTSSGKMTKEKAEKRLERIPSISSEDTVGTNGDTTDQEKRPQETGKGSAAKSQPPANNVGTATNAKHKKESSITKKTPSKGKLSKSAPASPVVETATSPSTTSKGYVNSKTNSGTVTSDTSGIAKTPGKSKTRSKSPISLVMELVRKQFETKKTRSDGSGKKAKSKKDVSIKETAGAANECVEKDNAGNGGNAGTKSKSKKMSLCEENVSSESDYEMLLNEAPGAGTPQDTDKRSRRSASTFIEQAADVSSESDYDESFLQAKKSVAEKQTVEKKPKKRIGRKRKQYNSETYSDEDFACLLTDIVRAVSDTEEDDEEEDEDAAMLDNEKNESITKTVPTAAESSTNSEDRNPKKKRKLKDVPSTATVAAADGKVPTPQSIGTTEMDQQPPQTDSPSVKKKKKPKEPKSSVKDGTMGSSCSTPETQISQLQKATGQQEAAAAPSSGLKRKKKQTTAANVPTAANDTETIIDLDDEDIQIVVNAPQDSVKKAPALGPECAWNEEMKQFYNTSWAGENMDLELVFRKMPYDTRQWPIVHRDQFPEPPRKEITCTNCGERGHVKFKCRNGPKLAICFMCGEKGHKEPRCPKTICLNCGAKTRSFVRGCKSCLREADVICFLCRVRGHTQRSCPGLWRRYHSTTEDNVPLKEDFERNPKARWCSICGRAGHQAHACNDARRIFGHPIPDVNVSSYMPAYRGEYNRYSKHQNDEQDKRLAENPSARYHLFSDDANTCEFNLHELAQNEKGFYFSFLRSTGLLEKHLQFNSEQEEARKQQEEQRQQVLMQPPPPQAAPSVTAGSTHPDPPDPVVQIKEEPEPAQQASVADPCQQASISSEMPAASDNVPVVEENSNYSFSEFHTDAFTDTKHNFSDSIDQHVEDVKLKSASPSPADNMAPTEGNTDQQQWLSDYLPLTVAGPVVAKASSPEPQQIPPAAAAGAPEPNLPTNSACEPVPPVTENAKVLLTKEHATLLLSENGAKFLSEAGKQHSVQLSILFESIGNVLVITGKPEAMTTFHEQLVQYLQETEQATINSKYFLNVVPKHCNKMTRYIARYLRCLVREKDSMQHLLMQLNRTKNPQTQEKYRRRLNTHLFGVYGMREGRMHLTTLRKELAMCMNANPWKGELEEHRRTIITDAIRYIFSGFDHKNYDAVVEEFEILKRTNKLQMLTFYDLGIPRIIGRPKTSEVPPLKKASKGKNSKTAVRINPTGNLNTKSGTKRIKQEMARQTVGKAHKHTTVRNADAAASANGDDFIMNIKPVPTIDPMRLQQLDSSTRYVHQRHSSPQERENKAYPSHYSKNWSNHERRRDERPSDYRDRHHRFRQSEARTHRQQQSSANISRLADHEKTLREQELSQLQRLQDLLRR